MKAPFKTEGFELAPAGNHLARIYGLVDIGMQETNFGEKHEIYVLWELPLELDKKGEVHTKAKRYTLSLNEKANLCKMIEGLLGRKLSNEQKEIFDFSKLVGKECMVSITHDDGNDGKQYANIHSVTPVARGMTVPAQLNPSVYFDLDDFNPADFESLPEWVRDKINLPESNGVEPEGQDDPFDI